MFRTSSMPCSVRLSAGCLAAVLAVNAAGPSSAAVFVVNTFIDSQDILPGNCIAQDANGLTSLRAAIMEANACPGAPHTISLPNPGVYTLALIGPGEDFAFTGDLDIRQPMTIQGLDPLNTVIDASACVMPPCPGTDRAFETFAPDVIIERLRIIRGYAPVGQEGGGIRKFGGGQLRLRSVHLIDCHALNGGAIISNAGPIMIEGSRMELCSASDNGGGLYLRAGMATLTLTEVMFNGTAQHDGGGVYTENGTTLTAQDSQFFANNARERGGAVAVGGSADASFINCHFEENTAALGGAVRTGGTTSFDRCTVVGNGAFGPPLGLALGTAGGGIYAFGNLTTIKDTTISSNQVRSGFPEDMGGGLCVDPIGTVEATGCTISGNLAGDPNMGQGGGVGVIGQLTMTNCTIAQNTSRKRGGGLYNHPLADTRFSHVTLAFNHAEIEAGGIYHDDPAGTASMQLIGSLIARNTYTVNPGPPPIIALQNCVVANPAFGLTSAGYNHDDDGTCGLTAPGDIIAPAGVLNLAANGGPTETCAILPGTPSVDAAPICSDLAGNAVAADQRGVGRPQGITCDIGAFELVPVVPANDDCASATAIVPGQHAFNNTGATTDGPADCFTGLPGQDSDIWYAYTSPCIGFTNVTLLAASNFDQVISVYDTVCPQAGGALIQCFTAPAGQAVGITLPPHAAGHPYVIRIGGVAGQQGNGVLDITVLCTCTADIAPPPFGNGVVNLADLLMVIANWGQGGGNPADLTHDGIVNLADLLFVIAHWGVCP